MFNIVFKDLELATIQHPGGKETGNLMEEKVEVDPWELPEFTQTSIPWGGIGVILSLLCDCCSRA